MQATWASLGGRVDAQRHAQVTAFLRIQLREAQWWRDASVAYFQSVSGRPLPAGEMAPPHPLHWYQSLQFPSAPGDGR
jgi:alpha-glucuronidase